MPLHDQRHGPRLDRIAAHGRVDVHAPGDPGLAVLRALVDQAQGRIRGLAVAGDDDDQVSRQRATRRITLPLFVRPDVALDQRIAQSLAVDLDLAAAG